MNRSLELARILQEMGLGETQQGYVTGLVKLLTTDSSTTSSEEPETTNSLSQEPEYRETTVPLPEIALQLFNLGAVIFSLALTVDEMKDFYQEHEGTGFPLIQEFFRFFSENQMNTANFISYANQQRFVLFTIHQIINRNDVYQKRWTRISHTLERYQDVVNQLSSMMKEKSDKK
jgi:hypothetical protein